MHLWAFKLFCTSNSVGAGKVAAEWVQNVNLIISVERNTLLSRENIVEIEWVVESSFLNLVKETLHFWGSLSISM